VIGFDACAIGPESESFIEAAGRYIVGANLQPKTVVATCLPILNCNLHESPTQTMSSPLRCHADCADIITVEGDLRQRITQRLKANAYSGRLRTARLLSRARTSALWQSFRSFPLRPITTPEQCSACIRPVARKIEYSDVWRLLQDVSSSCASSRLPKRRLK